jgi:predicted RNase H-like HicB family nuclease
VDAAGEEKGGLQEAVMQRHHYTVILEREEDGGYHAFCPALRGCHTQGDTLEEALANVREAIEAYLESLQKHGEAVPVEDILIKPVEVAL